MLCVASAHSASSGDDDQRRAFPPPREGLPLCVAPYFADRGVGDMRGPPTAPTKMPPRRWWQAVIVPRYTTETQQYTSHHDGGNSPAPPPGCDWVERPAHRPRMSPRPSVAKYGATHGCNPSRGSELPRLLQSDAPRPPHRHPEAAQRRVRSLSSAMRASPLPQRGYPVHNDNYAVMPGRHSIYRVRANGTPLPPTCILSLYPSRCKDTT